MAPIVLLRLFRADGDFNQATPHPADPIKCRTSTQRTQAPESVDTGRASRLDPLENSIDVKRTLRLRYVAHIRPRRETRPRPRSGILRPRGFRHHGRGSCGISGCPYPRRGAAAERRAARGNDAGKKPAANIEVGRRLSCSLAFPRSRPGHWCFAEGCSEPPAPLPIACQPSPGLSRWQMAAERCGPVLAETHANAADRLSPSLKARPRPSSAATNRLFHIGTEGSRGLTSIASPIAHSPNWPGLAASTVKYTDS
jgi:hypothetical protein